MPTEKQLEYWKRKRTHGESKTRLYRIWATMKERCGNSNAHAYSEYGGRGITVCREWEHDFVAFREWSFAHGYSESLSLDRIDNDKGYSPGNCRWATRSEQQRNKRTTRFATMNGETRPLAEWEEITGIGKRVLWNRLFRYGWSDEKALTTPLWGGPDREPNWFQPKAVHKCDKDGNILATFASIKDASETTGINKGNISNVIHGKRRIAGGYYWKFATEGGTNIEPV